MPPGRRPWAACTDSRRERWTGGRARDAGVRAFPTMGVARRRDAETRLTTHAVQRSSGRVIGLFDGARDGRARASTGPAAGAATGATARPRSRSVARRLGRRRERAVVGARRRGALPRRACARERGAGAAGRDRARPPARARGATGARHDGAGVGSRGAVAGAEAAGKDAPPARRGAGANAQAADRDGGEQRSGGGEPASAARRVSFQGIRAVLLSASGYPAATAASRRRLDGCLRGSSAGW